MDDEMRLLERAAQTGDTDARRRLYAMQCRVSIAGTIGSVDALDEAIQRLWRRVAKKLPETLLWAVFARHIGQVFTGNQHIAHYYAPFQQAIQILLVIEPDRATIGINDLATRWVEEVYTPLSIGTWDAQWSQEHVQWAAKADPGHQPMMMDRVQAPRIIFEEWARTMGGRHRMR